MTTPEALALINPDSGLALCEVVCMRHNLTFNVRLPWCPECRDDRL